MVPPRRVHRPASPRSLATGLLAFRKAMGTLRELDPEMSLTTAAFFVEVALAEPEGLTPGALAHLLDVASSGPRRMADLLGERGRGGKEGLGLVTEVPDPFDRRIKLFRLTSEGRKVADRISNVRP